MPEIKVGGFAPAADVALFKEKDVTAQRGQGEAPQGSNLPAVADDDGVATFTDATVLPGIAYMAYGERRFGGAGYVAALVSTTKGWPS